MKRIIYTCLILLAACSQPKQGGLIYYNDCESIKGWTTVTLSKEKAHSGVYSNKIDTIHPYGLGTRLLFKDISDKKIQTVKVNAWVFLKPRAKGKFVMEIRNHEGNTVLWDSYSYNYNTMETNNWHFVSKDFKVTDLASDLENTVAVYPMSDGKPDFYVDDIQVEFVTGN
ncbi:MAG TPA: hypothetical protein VK806_03015 [Bacteroidia bacterium]|jgi:hypothetical protein|nr:hypothetical protein [Bacteroidia bacterium]